jgi:hypothetical protein
MTNLLEMAAGDAANDETDMRFFDFNNKMDNSK